MRARVGRLLRRWADTIDPANAPTLTGWSYTHEKRGPRDTYLKWREDGRGCPVWYMGDADLNRSFTEADSDWRPAKERLADMLARHGEPRAYGGPVPAPQPMLYDPATDGPIRRLEDR